MELSKDLSFPKTLTTLASNSGYGTVYASGSSVYMINDSNELYDLTLGNGYMLLTEYNTPGTYTWNKQSDIDYLQVICVGGGGGGGGGGRGAASTNRGSGAGGNSGNIAIRWFSSASLTGSSYTITVGGGGTAGNSGSANGTDGGLGGNTSFSTSSMSLVSASGGEGGGAGNAGSATTQVDAVTPSLAIYSYPKMKGGVGGVLTTNYPKDFNNSASYAFDGYYGAGAGGGGGGITSANVLISGGVAPSTWNYGTLIATGSPGGLGNGGNGDNGVNYLVKGTSLIGFSSNFTSSYGVGTAGHGGGSGDLAGTINGGSGGNGGNFGAGGGGGGAATSPAQAGRGGTGGGGYVLLIEYY
jgi:hypothetical protein